MRERKSAQWFKEGEREDCSQPDGDEAYVWPEGKRSADHDQGEHKKRLAGDFASQRDLNEVCHGNGCRGCGDAHPRWPKLRCSNPPVHRHFPGPSPMRPAVAQLMVS